MISVGTASTPGESPMAGAQSDQDKYRGASSMEPIFERKGPQNMLALANRSSHRREDFLHRPYPGGMHQNVRRGLRQSPWHLVKHLPLRRWGWEHDIAPMLTFVVGLGVGASSCQKRSYQAIRHDSRGFHHLNRTRSHCQKSLPEVTASSGSDGDTVV